jgi:molybdate transport system ATP-binding protein
MNLSADFTLARGAFNLIARFETPASGVTALFGPSGAGKSMLLSALAGLNRIEQGRISLGGRVLDDVAAGLRIPPHQRGVGLVFQDARLLPHLSVRGNLAYAINRPPRDASSRSRTPPPTSISAHCWIGGRAIFPAARRAASRLRGRFCRRPICSSSTSHSPRSMARAAALSSPRCAA